MPQARLRVTDFSLLEAAPVEALAGEDTPDATPSEEIVPATQQAETQVAEWTGVIGIEGVQTGDPRMIEPNALRWDDAAIPLRHAPEDVGGHDGAVVVGLIQKIWRDGGLIRASGVFDLGSPAGLEAARLVSSGLCTGISMDLDSVAFEVRVVKEMLEPMPADSGDGYVEPDEDGRVKIYEQAHGDELMVITDAFIRAATIVAIPAFKDATISLTGPADDLPDSVTASVHPAVAALNESRPPAAWFSNPGMSGVTPITVTEEGRVFGHIAAWGTCHVDYLNECITPPSSPSGYAYFRTGSVVTWEGSEVATGVLTMDTLHAPPGDLGPSSVASHYSDTGRGVADVAAGEDAYGIWVSGAIRPGATAEQVRVLQASPMSGDWRRVGGALELVAVLAVNVPGFPIPRPHGQITGDRQVSLIASGMVPPTRVLPPGTPGALSVTDLRYLRRLIDREAQEDRRVEARSLAARANLLRVRGMAARLKAGAGTGPVVEEVRV